MYICAHITQLKDSVQGVEIITVEVSVTVSSLLSDASIETLYVFICTQDYYGCL